MMREKLENVCESGEGKQEHNNSVHKIRKISLEPTTTHIGVQSKLQHLRLDHDRVWRRDVQMSVA